MKHLVRSTFPRTVAILAALSMLMAGAGAAWAAPPGPAPARHREAPAPVTPAPLANLANLAHLDFLLGAVPLKPVPGHTTYRLAEQPAALAPWTYADKNDDGSYTRIGGGSLDPATGHWSQGAYNADDIARSAVVYLRHWRETGSTASRAHAFEVLRSLTYLQTTSGPNAGNVVLWQQADGTLNPSAIPAELPDPSDSADSYWLARTIWALGEGYAAFKASDPQFAAFLRDRLHLALASLRRQSLANYGRYAVADGVRVPRWLIAGGADASAEAVLGLAAYVRAERRDAGAADVLRKLGEGIAMMSAGSSRTWPFGAIMPSVTTQSLWHAWGGLAPAAVADAATALHRPDLLGAAVRDSAGFTPQLLAAGGPHNSWSPVPGEAQIAYGADSRVESLVATAKAANAPGLLTVAAVAAAWFFGANPSGQPAYNPATGAAIDGIETDGRVNPNSGAESTIHTLLAMLTLDANPRLKAQALGISRTVSTHGLTVVEAESGTVVGGSVTVPVSGAWTGEANLSGGAYVALNAGGTVSIRVPGAGQRLNVFPIVNRAIAPSGSTGWTARAGWSRPMFLGATPNGGSGAQGVTPAPGVLLPFSLERPLPRMDGTSSSGAAVRTTTIVGRTNGPAAIDALLLQPQISTVSVTGTGGDATLYVSAAAGTTVTGVAVPHGYKLTQEPFDSSGHRIRAGHVQAGHAGRVTVAPGGFTWAVLVRK